MLALEETLSGSGVPGAYSAHWQLAVGIIMLAIVMYAPQGIAGAFRGRNA